MNDCYDVFGEIKHIIPLWKWILLLLTKTYKGVDVELDRTEILYVKKLFNEKIEKLKKLESE